jgi:hypothetical protein
MPKNAEIYECEKCLFKCSKFSNWNAHVSTRKHKILSNTIKKMPNSRMFECRCGKSYKHPSSLYNHRKICGFIELPSEDSVEIVENIPLDNAAPNTISTEVVIELIKQNKDLQNALMEQNAKIMEMAKSNTIINNNTTNNTQNNHFNLQIFLNEQCKDAINMIEFVNSMQLELKDLEDAGKYGFVQAISNIFINGLNQLDIYKRPIHCTDMKRETLYVKDQDEWVKETQEKKLLKNAVGLVAGKNLKQLSVWQSKHPEFRKLDTVYNDMFLKIALNSLGGDCEEEGEKNKEKIMKNVIREVVLDKTITKPNIG